MNYNILGKFTFITFSQTMDKNKDFNLNESFQGLKWEVGETCALHIPGCICVKFAGSARMPGQM